MFPINIQQQHTFLKPQATKVSQQAQNLGFQQIQNWSIQSTNRSSISTGTQASMKNVNSKPIESSTPTYLKQSPQPNQPAIFLNKYSRPLTPFESQNSPITKGLSIEKQPSTNQFLNESYTIGNNQLNSSNNTNNQFSCKQNKFDKSLNLQEISSIAPRNTPPLKALRSQSPYEKERVLKLNAEEILPSIPFSPTLPEKSFFSKYSPQNIKSPDDNHKVLSCINHLNKKAKYCMPNDFSVSLCSKCAIAMVGQGFKIEEVSEEQAIPMIEKKNSLIQEGDISRRDQELNQFLNKLCQLIPNIEKNLHQLILKKDEIKTYYDQQKQKVKLFSEALIESIEQIKENLDQQIQLNLINVNQLYDKTIEELKASLKECLSMQQDIQINVDKILQQVDQNLFEEIMSSYHQNFNSFSGKIKDLQKKPIEVMKIQLKDNFISQMTTEMQNSILTQMSKTPFLKKTQDQKNEKKDLLLTIQSISNQDLLQTTFNTSLYVSFENKEKFHQNQGKTKESGKINKRQKNDVVPQVKIAYVQLYQNDEKENKSLFTNAQEIQESSNFEETPSQMIEREDIENSYNNMILDNDSDQEDIKQHLEEMSKADKIRNDKTKFKLFGHIFGNN